MPERTVAYLDLLGFKSYTVIDADAAAQLLLNYHHIINTKLADAMQFPARGYQDGGLRELAERGEVGSFETFLPFSDSVFVISGQPDLLVKQLSRFLIDSFAFTSDAFAHPEQAQDPTAVTIAELSLHGVVRRTVARWFPLLFRGGIAFGDVMTPRVTAILDSATTSVTNLAGTAVVNAVGLEKTGKGPRIFCKADFRNRLAVGSLALLPEVPETQCYELLWPAFLYHDQNSPHVDINHFSDLFLPAANLWRAFRGLDVEPHYVEFLKLIIKATLQRFTSWGCHELARNHIADRVAAYNLQDLRDILLPNSVP